MNRGLVAFVLALGVGAIGPASASASITSVFAGQTMSGQAIPCTAQPDAVRVCHGTDGGGAAADLRLQSFDGTPLEVWVILPPAPQSGTDGDYPLIVQSHGWGGPPNGPYDTQFYGPTADAWARDGYAVVQITARGWGDSCGSSASRLVNPAACANGYVHFDDARYEGRDIQNAIGELVDDGIADPNRIGLTGDSYGGMISLELATLKDRVMEPDGTLQPWTSPDGTPVHVDAAAPVLAPTDIVYTLMPNGRTLDDAVTGPTDDLSPLGVEKQSLSDALAWIGSTRGYYGPPASSLWLHWFSEMTAGEPYDGNPAMVATVNQISQYHAPYYLLDGGYGAPQEPPAPLLLADGFTDQLVPVDEALRYYNLDQSLYPSDPVTLVDGDFGHAAQNKPYDLSLLSSHIQSFFDHYVKGTGAQPSLDLTAVVETCPKSAPSGPTYTAPTWAALHPGEVDYSSAAAQTILSTAGNQSIAREIDPATGGGPCATVPSTDQGTGVATYRLPAVGAGGYTLLGSPTVTATLQISGEYAEIAARLWDVNPALGTETLVARGLYRPAAGAGGQVVFQLHPAAWQFPAGDVPKLELLGQDWPYARRSNGTFAITVSGLQLSLPVHEAPGSSPQVRGPRSRLTIDNT